MVVEPLITAGSKREVQQTPSAPLGLGGLPDLTEPALGLDKPPWVKGQGAEVAEETKERHFGIAGLTSITPDTPSSPPSSSSHGVCSWEDGVGEERRRRKRGEEEEEKEKKKNVKTMVIKRNEADEKDRKNEKKT